MKKPHPSNPSGRQGFTIVELLVVIGIIALLALFAVIGLNYARESAKIAKVRSDLDTIRKAITMLANDSREWPKNQPVDEVCSVDCDENEVCSDPAGADCEFGITDARAGIVATDGSYANWGGPYMPAIQTDPWGSQYFFDTDYRIDGDGNPCSTSAICFDAAVIGSFGPDREGRDGYGADDIILIIKR